VINPYVTHNTGAEAVVKFLKEKKVELLFCITGAGNLAIVDAVMRDGEIRIIYSQHEQASVMEAQGYARLTGKPGIALVTTGGGIANTFTGVLSAYLDSIPVFLLSGNESSFHCENWNELRAYGVQGFDSITSFSNITKNASRLSLKDNVYEILHKAWNDMISDRKGPVLVDIPLDLQRRSIDYSWQEILLPPIFANSIDSGAHIEKFLNSISDSDSPLLYIGNGCRDQKTIQLLNQVINDYKLPFVLSWTASDLISSEHPFNVGHVGIYGDRAANILLQKCDLLICIGTRLAIPQIGYDKADFARNAEKWYVDIDPTECGKFADLNWNLVQSSAFDFLEKMSESLVVLHQKPDTANWIKEIDRVWKELPRIGQVGELDYPGYVHSSVVINFLNQNLSEDAVVVTDVGAGLLSGHYMFEPKANQRLITSQGLGEMGFGLPGALGAYFGDQSRQIICLNTDGAIMFNLQEMQLISQHKVPIKLFVFNNLGYSMIKISQENLFDGRYAGSNLDSGISFPSFEKLADIFSMEYFQIKNEESLSEGLISKLDNDKPVLIEVLMSPEQKYYPRLATSKNLDGTLVSPPLEDLDPKISIDLLENLLTYKAHPNSYKARGH
jgi:acetolactate synthase I/II/III large subunit